MHITNNPNIGGLLTNGEDVEFIHKYSPITVMPPSDMRKFF